ncbi:hypothetical protein COO60DRAFT_92485 [Scenedesmus sp. NREL 46B-D3]|nr:hypothetical protein COO60DRAFT_92485 [Scenedesmus sp. NREL 46B-D3]
MAAQEQALATLTGSQPPRSCFNPEGRPAAEIQLASALGGRSAELAESDARREAQQLQVAADAVAAAAAQAQTVTAAMAVAGRLPAGGVERCAVQALATLTERGAREAAAAAATLRDAAAAAVTAARAAAARAGNRHLLLQSFSSPTPSAMVLQALPLGQLTRLEGTLAARSLYLQKIN